MNAQTQTIDEPQADAGDNILPYYSTDMDAAREADEPVLLVIPTGDPEDPLTVEMGFWNGETGRWEGEWRETVEEDGETPTELSKMEPIAWGEVPEIDDYLYKLIGAEPPKAEAA